MSAHDLFQQLARRLASCGALSELDPKEERETRVVFQEAFGAMFREEERRLLRGRSAMKRYRAMRAERILVLSQPVRAWAPHGACSPFPFALLCVLSTGEPPDLGAYCDLEPCVTPDDFAWAMVHTHEDGVNGGGMGGPYFVEAAYAPGESP